VIHIGVAERSCVAPGAAATASIASALGLLPISDRALDETTQVDLVDAGRVG
jgi:hypothetical protein